jgi:transcriptional regulator with XRE-family HTH domain
VGAISHTEIKEVKKLYYERKMSMREIAVRLGVSLDAVVYFMRHHNIERRTYSENKRIQFERKKPSFIVRARRSNSARSIDTMGAMLYWAEGHKTEKANGIDFANSDPEMIRAFIFFLRSRYRLTESKFRPHLYCYSDQNVSELRKFWSQLLNVPVDQFIKPYVRQDFKKGGRKMEHGLVHIRYHDKKLLYDILELIESHKVKYCVGG